jgi:hypothetical protein
VIVLEGDHEEFDVSHKMKMKMIYNNTNKIDRLLSNGKELLSHVKVEGAIRNAYTR